MERSPQRDILRAMHWSRFGLALARAACAGCAPTYSQKRRAEAERLRTAVDATAPMPRPELAWRALGTSVKGRPLRVASIGHGPRRVLWIGGIHGDEREGRVATEELPTAFVGVPGAVDRVTLTILEDANPDGTAMKTRGNANGVDLNRNYPAKNFKPVRAFGIKPLSQPESRVVHDLILDGNFDLVIVAHSWRDDHFINYDGPAAAAASAALFAARSGYPVRDSGDMSPTPGSLGSWVGRTLNVPILTLEYHRGRDPWAAWEETRIAIVAVIVEGPGLAALPSTEEDAR